MNRAAAPRILWIGPEGPGGSLRDALGDHGWPVLQIESGAAALATCARLRHDAIVLAPGRRAPDETVAAVRALRRLGAAAALMVLCPGLAPIDEVLLLGAGADAVADTADGALVVLARLRCWLRRASAHAGDIAHQSPLRLGRLEVDGRMGCVRVDGRALPLGASAAALLHELAARDGGPAPRADLARRLGPAGLAARSRTVDMAISRLRQALRAEGVREVAIESVRGRGYRMVLRGADAGLQRAYA